MSIHSAYSQFNRNNHLNKNKKKMNDSEEEEESVVSSLQQSQHVTSVSPEQSPAEEEEDGEQIVVCVNVNEKMGVMGLCYFDYTDGCLHLLAQDLSCPIQSLPSLLQIIASQFNQVRKVILPSSASEIFFTSTEDAFPSSQLENVSSHLFNPLSAKHLISSDIVLMEALVDDQLIWDTCSSDCAVSLGCVSALLEVVVLNSSSSDQSGGVVVVRIVADTALDSQMMVTKDTLTGLQVFSHDTHPNHCKSGGKEGISLFSLLDNTCTPQGNRLLSTWVRRPLTSLPAIQKRLDTVEYLLARKSVVKSVQSVLRGCKSVWFVRKAAMWSVGEWKGVYRFFYSVNQLIQLYPDLFDGDVIAQEDNGDNSDNGDGESCFMRLKRLYTLEFVNLGNEIQETIDFDVSSFENRCVVNYGVDPDLDSVKRQYDNLDMLLNQVAERMKPSFPRPDIQGELRIVYFPQIGFLVALPAEMVDNHHGDGDSVQDVQVPGDYHRMFVSDMMVFFKCDAMRELDESIGDIHHIIVDKEIEVLYALQVRIAEYQSIILEMSDTVAEIDVFVSLAVCSDTYSYCRPVMTDDDALEIVDGRHPLLEQSTQVICNTCSLDTEQRVIMLTGPNASGKSIYLKQVGLIVYMAQIGCFVPAKAARIGVCDGIFSRIATTETLEKNASSFLIDLRQMYVATKYATARSLVLIDEFGKGTSLADGVGLVSGVLDFFCASAEDVPRIVMTTHYHDLVSSDEYLSEPVRAVMKHQQMQVYTDPRRPDEVAFLYKVVDGVCMNSLGCYLARLVGMPSNIVERAETVSKRLIDRLPIEPDAKLIAQKDEVDSMVQKVASVQLTAEDVRLFLSLAFP